MKSYRKIKKMNPPLDSGKGVLLDRVIQRNLKFPNFVAEKSHMGIKKITELVWSKWYLIPEVQRGKETFCIKRYRKDDSKTYWERYIRAEYATLKGNDLKAFVERLNGEKNAELARAKLAYQIKHTFITEELLEQWEKHIVDSQNDQTTATEIIVNVHRLFLHFFINKMKLNDPLDWYEQQETWGKVLLNTKPKDMPAENWKEIKLLDDGIKYAEKTIKAKIMFANRFVAFIHKKKPRLFPLLVFDPIPKAVLKRYEANRTLDKNTRYKWFVKPEDWTKILNECDKTLLPFVKLSYFLGLRDAETLGVQIEDVGRQFFDLRRQLTAIPDGKPSFGPPKSGKPREIPYWMSSPKEIYSIIQSLTTRMHSDTLGRKVSDEMKRLELPYTMHDFRRTWITRCLHSGKELVKVKDAAGHAQISTTNLYILNMDSVNNERYNPEED